MRLSVAHVVVLVVQGFVGLGMVGGCASQRPLPRVREDGDRAFQKGEFDKALADYVEYVDRKPGEEEVRHQLALTLLEVGMPEKAAEHAWIAHDQRPQRDEYVETLARALYESKQTDQMYKFLRGMVTDRGRVADYTRLGTYAAKVGDADEAEHALMTAAKLDGGRTIEPQLALADFYMGINDKQHAITRLRMALYIEPVNKAVNDRLRALGEIPGPSLALKPEESP